MVLIIVKKTDEKYKCGREKVEFKGSDRQSEVVELSMQYCAQIL